MIKKKVPHNKVAAQLKKIGIVGGIATRKGQWELERGPKKIQGKPKKKEGKPVLALSLETKMQAAKDRASGMTIKHIAEKYSVSESYINDSLQTLFLKSGKAREVLRDVLFNNAVACGMRVRQTVDELNPMQAVIATGIMTQRAIDIDKHVAGQTADIDFSQLNEVSDLLRDLRGHVALPSDKEGDIIDIGQTLTSED